MNIESDAIYGGISAARLPIESFELGSGIVMTRTFAHLMAPFLMAFAPAEVGKPHPAPWSPVHGGFGFDIHIQLAIPAEFSPPVFFDRLNTVWWIAALLRLQSSPSISVPVISNRPYASIAANPNDAELLPMEVMPRRVPPSIRGVDPLSPDHLAWIQEHWVTGARLMRESPDLNTAFQAFDSAPTAGSPSLALLSLWGALERLFLREKQELRFRVSASIASFLEPVGGARLALHRRLLKIYNARSEAAHGTAGDHGDPFEETYAVLRRALIKIVENGRVPNRDELEQRMFAGADAFEHGS